MTNHIHEEALAAFSASDFNKALSLLEQALAQGENSDLWNDWGSTQLQLDRWKEASEGFRRAVELNAENRVAANNLVAILQSFATYDEQQRADKNRTRLLEEIAKMRERTVFTPGVTSNCGRNLVIGLAANYSTSEIAPFVQSLRDSGFDGDIVLFVLSVDASMRQLAVRYRVQFKYWPGMFFPLDLQLGRLFTYYDYLAQLDLDECAYNSVLLTDVRDVFFQSDPFLPVLRDELLVFLEDSSRTIGTCPYNSAWVQTAFGEAALHALFEKRISCSGTVLGSWNRILEYLLSMQLLAQDISPASRFVKGIDQGIHNVLIHHQVLNSCRLVENGDRVFTMHYVPKADIQITCAREIADAAGRVPAVIHQYDRHPELCQLVQESISDRV